VVALASDTDDVPLGDSRLTSAHASAETAGKPVRTGSLTNSTVSASFSGFSLRCFFVRTQHPVHVLRRCSRRATFRASFASRSFASTAEMSSAAEPSAPRPSGTAAPAKPATSSSSDDSLSSDESRAVASGSGRPLWVLPLRINLPLVAGPAPSGSSSSVSLRSSPGPPVRIWPIRLSMSLLFELFFSSEAMNLLELAAVLAALLLSTAVKTLELAAGFPRETKAGDEEEDEVETFCRKREPIES
jgi:hypothetical protein